MFDDQIFNIKKTKAEMKEDKDIFNDVNAGNG